MYNEPMVYSTVVVAAGTGSRSQLPYNKVLYPIQEEKWVLDGAVASFIADSRCLQIIIVASQQDQQVVREHFDHPKIEVVLGGATRQASVLEGLKQARQPFVMVHDGARPYLSLELIDRLVEGIQDTDGVILALPVVDTLKQVDQEGFIVKTLDRSVLWLAQTPQVFDTKSLLACHQQALVDGLSVTDDASVMEAYGKRVKVIRSEACNFKITRPDDLKKGEPNDL